MTAQRRRGVLLALLAVAALNAGAYAAYTLPRSLQQRSMAARAEVLRKELEQERRRVAELKGRVEAIEANGRDAARFYQTTVQPRGTSLVPVLQQIETLAGERGLRVGQQGFKSEPVKGATLERFVVTMPVSGTYRQLVGFVESLERAPYFLTLDQVQVRGSATGEQARLELVLSCYFRAGTETKS